MASIPDLGSSAFLEAVEKTLMDDVRAALKAPLMLIAEAEVDAAVDKAVEGLRPRAKAWRDDYNDRRVIEILFKRVNP